MSYNPDHQKIYQEDRYRICIAYFVLFQIMLIYVQLLLSITLLEQRSDAVSAICCADCANFLPVNAKTLFFCSLRPEGCVQLTKVTWLNLITSSNTNLDQMLEYLLDINFNISTKHQHLAET